jgi:Cu(I)/Ag(I) efflux system membrane protein CusA/SilA
VINRVILWSLRNRLLVVCATAFFVIWGLRSIDRMPVDAIPHLGETQVLLRTEWTGRSPQEVEDQITVLLVTELSGLTGIKSVRATSLFGLSAITVVLEESVDLYFGRARILERTSQLRNLLPEDAKISLGPDATGLGWVYQYYLEVDPKVPRYNLVQLRSIQDWYVRYHLASVPGVAEVAGIGGLVRQYQVEVSSHKLRSAGVSLTDVLDAVGESDLNVGGKTIDENGFAFVVRGVGLIGGTNAVHALEQIVVSFHEGTPIHLRELGKVSEGGAYRTGALDINGKEAVGGVVIMQNGANARAVIAAVQKRVKGLQSGLPPGISIRPFYDRSELIDQTLGTLSDALTKELLLVALAHILFLWHFRSVLIVSIPLPIAVLIAFALMDHFGMVSDIMSLGGIAMAVGVLADAGIVMAENVIRQNSHRTTELGRPLTAVESMALCGTACQRVGRPMCFSILIILAAFLPVFFLPDQAGKLFHPLAYTKTFVMVGALLLSLTLVPVLCSCLVRGRIQNEEAHWLMSRATKVYAPILAWALAHRRLVVTVAAGIFLVAVIVALGLPRPLVNLIRSGLGSRASGLVAGMGSEFMPRLNEGSLLFMPVLTPGASLSEVKKVMAWQDRVISQVPEVRSVAGKLGRADTATDPAPVEMIETTILLHPEFITTNRSLLGVPYSQTIRNPAWRPGMTQERLVAELMEKVSVVPGYVPAFLQPIENRILMLNTGIRGQVGIKVFGPDLETIQREVERIEAMATDITGASGVVGFQAEKRPYVEFELDRFALAQQGMRAKGIMDVIEAGIGGRVVSTTIEGRERVPVRVRLAREERTDLEQLGSILVQVPNGAHLPLDAFVRIRRTTGPSAIHSEDGRLMGSVQMNVRGRDLGRFVEELKTRIRTEIEPDLPVGVALELSGLYEQQLAARSALQWIVPGTLVVIFVLLYLTYRSAGEALHVLLAVPFALTGGVALQYAMGIPFSVAVWVGYIALFGTAVQTTVVMVVYLDQAVQKRMEERGTLFSHTDLVAAAKEGALLRLRPKLMTVATVIASLMPILLSPRMGAEIMRPLATPIVGGMASSLVHVLIVTPVLFVWLHGRKSRSAAEVSGR